VNILAVEFADVLLALLLFTGNSFIDVYFCDRASGGKLVDASPATEKAMTDELEKLARVYGAKGDDFTKFPTFNFTGNSIC